MNFFAGLYIFLYTFQKVVNLAFINTRNFVVKWYWCLNLPNANNSSSLYLTLIPASDLFTFGHILPIHFILQIKFILQSQLEVHLLHVILLIALPLALLSWSMVLTSDC